MSLLYVWTATGGLSSLTFPADLAASAKTTVNMNKEPAPTNDTADPTIEPFIDNLRRSVSSVSSYIEIPFNNVLSTGQAREPLPVFKFMLGRNKRYKFNALIRARTDYKYTVPILAKYTLESNSPSSLMNYRATYMSSNETAIGEEKNSNVLGAVLTMVVDSKISLLRLTATFQTNAVSGINGVEFRLHHGLQTDDPDAKLYALEGSYGVLSEVVEM